MYPELMTELRVRVYKKLRRNTQHWNTHNAVAGWRDRTEVISHRAAVWWSTDEFA